MLSSALESLPFTRRDMWFPTSPSHPHWVVEVMGQEGWSQAGLILPPSLASRALPGDRESVLGLVWRTPLCSLPNEFCGGMAYCGSQAGVGLLPQGDLETPPPQGKAGGGAQGEVDQQQPPPSPSPTWGHETGQGETGVKPRGGVE